MLRLTLLALWASATAAAAVPISLPPSEALAPWRSAFELADLEPAPSRAEASVRIRVSGRNWAIVAVAPDGRERFETVRRPTTPVEREEVALLAQSLARELAIADTPDPWRRVLPPPAPPPQPPPRARPAPAPPPVPDAAPPRERPVIQALAPLPLAPLQVDAEVFRPTPTGASRRRRPIALPGMHLGPLLTFRPNMQTAAGLELGLHPGRWGRWSTEVTLQGLASANLSLSHVRDRTLMQLHARMAIGYHPIAPLELQAGLGGTLLHFRQQFDPVDTVFVPAVALGTTVTLFRWRMLSLAARAHGVADLSTVQLYTETGARRPLSPFTGVVSVVLRTSILGDPKATLATSSR